MALFTDRRKPVDIYKQGSPTQVAQAKTSAVATAPIRTAVNYGALAPAKMAFNRIVAPTAQAAVAPISNAMDKQQQYLASQETKIVGRAADREADALLYGSGTKQIGNNTGPQRLLTGTGNTANTGGDPASTSYNIGQGSASPAIMNAWADPVRQQSANGQLSSQNPATVEMSPAADAAAGDINRLLPQRAGINPMQPGAGWIRIEDTGETVSMDGSGKITMADAQGRKIDQMTKLIGNVPAVGGGGGQPQRATGGINRVGNLDITFDDSLDPAARERLLRDPVRPTAQIDRYNAQRNGSGGLTQGQLASMNAGRILMGGPDSIDGTSGGSGSSRLSAPPRARNGKDAVASAAARRDYYNSIETGLKERELANREAGTANELMIANNKMGVDVDRNGIERLRYGADLDRLGIEREKLAAEVANSTARNEIDRLNVTGTNAERNANAAAKNLEVRQREEVARLQADYEAAPDEKTKKAIEQKLVARGVLKEPAPKVFFDEQLGSMGEVIRKTPYIIDNGVVRPALDGGQDQGATTPPPKESLEKGKTYTTAKGKAIWNGSAFVPVG